MASVSAISVRLLIEKPSHHIATNVMRNDIGNATMGMRVSVARPRKTKITKMTSAKATSSVNCTSCNELTIDCDRSNTGMRRMEPGSSRCSSGSNARTEWATCTAFAPA